MIRIRVHDFYFSSGFLNFSSAKNITLIDFICSQHSHLGVSIFGWGFLSPDLITSEAQGLGF